MPLTADTLVHAGVPRATAERYLPLLTAGMREFGITNQRRGSFYIAQLLLESVRFTAFHEYASGAEYEGRRDLGNVHPGDGVRYKGRGPIQLTGRANYRFYGHKLGLDLEGHPELAAEPRIGFRTAAMYWQLHHCNEMADHGDFLGVTRAINGGLNGLADRQHYLRLLQGHDCTPGKAGISRGDKGDAVTVMTRRLAYVHSPKSDKPYLDGKRSVFDRQSEKALKRFQKEHGLKATGVFDVQTQNKLAKRVAVRKARLRKVQQHQQAAPPQVTVTTQHQATTTATATKKHRTTAELIAALERNDAQRTHLLALLLRRGVKLEQAAGGSAGVAVGNGAGSANLDALAQELGQLESMIEDIRAKLAANEAPAAAGQPAGQVH